MYIYILNINFYGQMDEKNSKAKTCLFHAYVKLQICICYNIFCYMIPLSLSPIHKLFTYYRISQFKSVVS